jgi:MFS family permease
MVLCTAFTRSRKAKISISWFFFTQGAILGNWAGILPAVKQEQDLSNEILGAILVAAIFGAMAALPIVSWVTKQWGSGMALFLGAILTLFLFPIVGIKTHVAVFIVGVFLLGFGAGWADVSMNSQAVLCEKMTRLPTLGLFHSVYAIGGLVGALIGGVLIQRGLNVFGEIFTVCGVLLVPQVFFSCWLYSQQEERLFSASNVTMFQYDHGYEKLETAHLADAHRMIGLPRSDSVTMNEPLLRQQDMESSRGSGGARDSEQQAGSSSSSHGDQSASGQTDWQVFEAKTSQVDYRALLTVSALCFLGYFGYGSVGDWSAIYLTEDLNSDPVESTLGYVGFSLFVALGTYVSDWFVVRMGRKRLLQCAGIVGALGLAIAVIAISVKDRKQSLICAIFGFSICGMGLSVVAPSVISLAGSSITGMDPTDAIAFVSSVGYVGVMVGPPLLGGVAAILDGLRWSFIVDAALMLLITVLASFITVARQRDPLRSIERQEDATIQ